MKRKILGIVCMTAGAILIGAALLLLLYNQNEDKQAGQAVEAIMPRLLSSIMAHPGTNMTEEHVNPYDEEAVAESYEMTVTEIDGYGYIGYLSIPALELEPPIMSEWDYPRMKIAPCRQFGSTKSDDLVIAGHNYRRLFGYLSRLRISDMIQFTDMDGEVSSYLVDNIAEISATAIEEVQHSQWELVLYTCTYDGQSRVMVGCRRITEGMLD